MLRDAFLLKVIKALFHACAISCWSYISVLKLKLVKKACCFNFLDDSKDHYLSALLKLLTKTILSKPSKKPSNLYGK